MNALLARLQGRKTYIGIVAACAYSLLIAAGVVTDNELVWTAILAWTGVSLRSAVK